jgi:LacI family transcriptional regulator
MSRPVAVTIEHVAAAAGVSRQTVSRVINNGPNVKPAVRTRVQMAIEAMGYVPNLAARRRRGRVPF